MATRLPSNVLRRVAKDLKDMHNSPPEGITVIPNDEDMTEILAHITGPVDTPYEGGLFKVKLKLGPDFPQAPPKGFFLTKIFHPNVSEAGEICLNTLKKDWKETLGFPQILLTIKCLLIIPNPESSLNEEAGRLMQEHYDDYFAKAKLFTSIHAPAAATDSSEEKEKAPKPSPVDETESKENKSNNSALPLQQQPQQKVGAEKPTLKKTVPTNAKRGAKRL